MKNQLFKRISIGTAAVLIVCLGGLALAAMFLERDGEEMLGWLGVGNQHKVTQPMELQGRWLGLRLSEIHSRVASRYRIPPSTKGVLVSEISERNGIRARQAGVLAGDVIQAVDEHKVRDMADLFDATRDVDVTTAVILDVLRWGQPMTLVLPGVYMTPPAQAQAGRLNAAPQAAAPQAAAPQASIPQAATPPVNQTPVAGANVNGAQPAAFTQGAAAGQFYCPRGGHFWNQAAVHPNYRCPRCNGPLSGVQ